MLGIALLAKNWIFMVPFAAHLAGPGAIRPFLVASLLPILWVAVSFATARILADALAPQSFLDLAVIGILTAVPFAASAAVSLPREDVRFMRREAMNFAGLMRLRRKARGDSSP